MRPFLKKPVYILPSRSNVSFSVFQSYYKRISLLEKYKIINVHKPREWHMTMTVSQSRGLQSSSFSSSKEPSKVEETVKVLKEEVKKKGDEVAGAAKTPATPSSVVTSPPKRSLGKRIVDEIIHYYHGFRLLFIDIRVSVRYVWKISQGEQLTRREHRQLVRAVADLFRLVPFSIFIIIPFMELLLPVFLKFFPQMLPSTFQTTSDKVRLTIEFQINVTV